MREWSGMRGGIAAGLLLRYMIVQVDSCSCAACLGLSALDLIAYGQSYIKLASVASRLGVSVWSLSTSKFCWEGVSASWLPVYG